MSERLITDDYPCKAVRYWLKCNSGKFAKVFCKNNRTVFIGAYGETPTFDHALDFNDAEMYFSLGDRWFSTEELCGEEEE